MEASAEAPELLSVLHPSPSSVGLCGRGGEPRAQEEDVPMEPEGASPCLAEITPLQRSAVGDFGAVLKATGPQGHCSLLFPKFLSYLVGVHHSCHRQL